MEEQEKEGEEQEEEEEEEAEEEEVIEEDLPPASKKGKKVPVDAAIEAVVGALAKRDKKRAAMKKPAAAKVEAVKAEKVSGSKKAAAGKVSGSKKAAAPSFSVEWSRSQVLCRTGRKGDPSVKFPFDVGKEVAAISKARKWVEDMKKEMGL